MPDEKEVKPKTTKELLRELLKTSTVGKLVAEVANVQEDLSREARRKGGQEEAARFSKFSVLLRKTAIKLDEIL